MVLNPLSIIVTQNKLNSDNYVDWKCNLDILFTTEKHKWVLNIEYTSSPKVMSSMKN